MRRSQGRIVDDGCTTNRYVFTTAVDKNGREIVRDRYLTQSVRLITTRGRKGGRPRGRVEGKIAFVVVVSH